jgi:hypothetical protein
MDEAPEMCDTGRVPDGDMHRAGRGWTSNGMKGRKIHISIHD